MNDVILMQLKILVERVVRPLRASASYKRRIREELLAHVSTVFHEESAILGDERAALDRTAQRFGDAAELTRQLQQAMPRGDVLRRLGDSLFGFGPSQSTWRRSVRHGISVSVSCAAAFGLHALLMLAFVPQRLRAFDAMMLGLFIICLCIFVAGLLFLAHWVARVLLSDAERSWRRAVPIAAASGLLLPIAVFVLCIGLSGDAWSSLQSALPLGAGYMVLNLVLTPWIVILIAWRLAIEIRAFDEWATLSIGNEKEASA